MVVTIKPNTNIRVILNEGRLIIFLVLSHACFTYFGVTKKAFSPCPMSPQTWNSEFLSIPMSRQT